MRKLSALITAAAAATLLAGAVQAAQPTASKPQVTVTVGGDLLKEIDKLGERDVQQQVDDLADVFGYSTWTDADRAFDGLAANLRRGRLVSR